MVPYFLTIYMLFLPLQAVSIEQISYELGVRSDELGVRNDELGVIN